MRREKEPLHHKLGVKPLPLLYQQKSIEPISEISTGMNMTSVGLIPFGKSLEESYAWREVFERSSDLVSRL